MSIQQISIESDHIDDHVDAEIDACLNLDRPNSFFLLAGAGSGKTRSLVTALTKLRVRSGAQMRLRGQQVAVITYTNAACDEINRRVDFDPLFSIRTIHSFIWSLIQGFNDDIRIWLKCNLAIEIEEIREEQAKGRKGQAAIDREQKIKTIENRLSSLDVIKTFIYSPTGENRTRDSLSHSEVIKIGAVFLDTKPLMQKLLTCKFPVLLIDESQDTNKLLIDAFLKVENAHRGSFCLGLIGDTMQRIYSDGKVNLEDNLSTAWKKPAKVMNHRCPRRVIKLINKIRLAVDSHQQRERSDAIDGHVRFFIAPSTIANKFAFEQTVRQRMAEVSGDGDWRRVDHVKTLTLEHHMAARRMEFLSVFEPLDTIKEYKTGLRNGSLSLVSFFSESILPLVTAKQAGNEFAVAALMREKSPLLTKHAFMKTGVDQAAQVRAAKMGVEALMSLFSQDAQPTFLSVLKSVAESNIFVIPDGLLPFANSAPAEAAIEEPDGPDDSEKTTKKLAAVRAFLGAPFAHIKPYVDYVSGNSPFDTHQGIKGLEFPRVFVILDDEDAGGFLFSFDKLFGAKEKTPADKKNEQAGTDTGIDRTRRLFYVTCSRSQSSLALMAYSSDPSKVRNTLLAQGWFDADEIEMLSDSGE